MEITGSTSYYVQLADPVAHVRFPQVMQPILDGMGLDMAIVPIHVRPAGLTAMVTGIRAWENVVGVGVTMPHKKAIVPMLDETTLQASQVGAVNLIRREPDGRLVGTMIDGLGFVAGLREHDRDPAGSSALLIGAGGTARAIAFALADAGVAEMTISNRTAARAEGLAAAVGEAFPRCKVRAGTPDPRGRDLVVNATNLGMKAGDGPPVDFDRLAAETIVADVVMVPARTPLLAAAEARGCFTMPGRAMIQPQIALVLEFLRLGRVA